ncbi:hypothetical protein ADK57_28505 [Streptomyces sp. MMG1533]|uniref:hypothetical protein n=1 Tax=Streptomyces sp. MMG1533 TaxID=1415546 RepID=UPI0006AE2EDD|nr:hypothetical protein [Streptomyces sp. MMG1533]KOU61082.1 hypothetical protein ADK57_28505 [Streptomyces sp. MMG1533]
MTDALVRRWSDRVTAVLCQRHPEGTRWVSHDQARRVGADPAALWDAALANVRAELLRLETVAGDGGAADLAFATGDDRFGLGHLLRLGELIQGPAPHGVLVGILGAPGLFAFHKVVRRREAEAAVEALRRLSPDGRHDTSFTGVFAVHWWRGGGPNDTEEVAPRAELSPRMAEMLDGLPD